MGGYIFVNEAIHNAINNYFLYKNEPDKLAFNTFDVVVAKILVWLYGELDITNCVKTMNEHGMGGFDMNICKYGYTEQQLHNFKNDFQKYYEIEEYNKQLAFKVKNPYMDIVQKELIDMYFLKKINVGLDDSQDKILLDSLFTIRSEDFYKQTYALLMSNDPYEVYFYFNTKKFKLYNNYSFTLFRMNILDLAIYDFFGIDEQTVNSFNQKQINSVNSQFYSYFQIEEDDEKKLEKLITAINNTKKRPKVDIIY